MKLVKVIVALSIMSGAAQAATISVSAGLSSQGLFFYEGDTLLTSTNYYVGVGLFDVGTSTFNFFGAAALDGNTNNKANGSFTATGGTEFNSQIINVFVGTGNSIANSGDNWVVFKTNANTAFPANVAVAGTTNFALTLPSGLTILGKGNEADGFFSPTISPGTGGGYYQFTAVPEPTAALLGAFGVLGLLRRRRN